MYNETSAESISARRVLTCISDAATRVFDLNFVLSELKAQDPSGYDRLFRPDDGHMTAAGNKFVAAQIVNFMAQHCI